MALYDDILAAETAPPLGADPRFLGSLELNTESNPDEIAKQRGLSKQLGVPLAAVETMPVESAKAARIKQIENDTAQAPVLREKFINQDFAKLAHDDTQSLSALELGITALRRVNPITDAVSTLLSATGRRQNTPTEQLVQDFTQRAGTNLLGGATVGLGAGLMDTAAVGYDVLSAATSWALPVDVFGQQAANARGGANRARESLDWAQGGKATSSTLAAIDSGMRSTGTNLALMPLAIQQAALRGAQAGGSLIAGVMGSQVGAEAYNNAREKGMERTGAATYAIPQAVFEWAFEKVPASRLLNDLAQNSGLLRMASNQLIPEMLGEQATTVLQDLNEQVRLHPEKTMRQFLEERPEAAYQTAIATLVGIGTQSSIVQAFAPAQQEAFKAQQAAQQSEQDVAQLNELFVAATNNKLRERSPETFQDLVQSIADSDTNAAPSTVFIDAAALGETLQQAGITEQQLAELLPSVPAQMQEALTTNGTVEIPLGELLARVAGTGLEDQLLQHIRMTPDALSQVEAKTAAEEAATMLSADAQRVIAESAVGAEIAQSAALVHDNILGQLQTTGRFTNDVNSAYAALVRDFYTATSSRLGITPEQLYAQYPLRIGATAPEGVDTGSLEQYEPRGQVEPEPIVEAVLPDNEGNPYNIKVSKTWLGINRDTQSVLVEARDASGLRRGVIDFGVNPDGTLGAENTIVAGPYRGKGIATAMYQAAAAAGYKIAPGRYQTPEGRKMVEALQARGLIGPGATTPLPKATREEQAPITETAHVRNVLEQSGRTTGDTIYARHANELLNAMTSFPPNSSTGIMLNRAPVPDLPTLDAYGSYFTKANRGATRQQVVQALYTEALAALTDHGNAVGWYDAKTKAALALMAQVHPEIATDPRSKHAFTTILAVTSNGLFTRDQFVITEALYRKVWKETGRFPESVPMGGTRRGNMERSFAQLNGLIDQHGWEAVKTFMEGTHTAAEVKAWSGSDNTFGEQVDSLVPGAVFLGPKLGAYFTNLNGDFSPITMDRWFMRTINRVRGLMITLPGGFDSNLFDVYGQLQAGTDTFGQDRAQILREIQTYSRLPAEQQNDVFVARETMPTLAAYAKARNADYARPKLQADGTTKSYADRSPENNTAKTINQALTALNDAPFRASDRTEIRGIFEEVQALLSTNGIELTNADLQAVLWYYEKDLLDKVKSGKPASELAEEAQEKEAEDYETAARYAVERLRQQGIAPAIPGRVRSGGVQPGDAAGGAVAAGADAGVFAQSARQPLATDTGRSAGADRQSNGLVTAPALIGLPTKVEVNGQPLEIGPFIPARQAAADYMRAAGLGYNLPSHYVKADPERGARIAAAYAEMKHDPQNPEVKAAYDAMIAETLAQYDAILATGLQVEFITGEDPYAASPRLATEDVRRNNHMFVYSTRDGFGSSDVDVSDNPLLAETKYQISGQTALANDIFRVVHDYFGHVKEGVGFRADGEENAWRSHASMYSPLARRAMTTETRGQNSWVNFGPHGEKNRTAMASDTVFADQKTGLLPEWVSEEGRSDMPTVGVHFSRESRTAINGAYYSTGLKGAEADRLNASSDPRLKSRVYFYIDEGKGIRPEAGVGGQAHEVPLPELYDAKADPLKLWKSSDLNGTESAILDAGYGGYYVRDLANQQGFAVVIGPQSAAMKATPIANPTTKAPPQPVGDRPYKRALTSAELGAIDLEQIKQVAPSANVRMGNFTVNTAELEAARALASTQGIELPDLLEQGVPLEQTARGTFNPATLQITLLERADLSTFLHELGHFFLEVQADIAAQPGAPAEVQQDMATLLKWFGVKDLATWQGMSLEQQRASHEKFAESFEQYLFEGKAPSRELQSLFGRFRAWMLNVYRSLAIFMAEHNTQLSDDVRDVFDRLLADADQIRDAQRMQAYQPAFESIADSGMSIEEWEAYQRTGSQATTDALDNLQARSLRDMQWATNARGKMLSKLQREAKDKRKSIEAEITAEVDAEPAYAALRWLKTGVLPDGTQTVGAKLDTTALKEMYGENPAAPWRYLSTDVLAAQDGMHPDMAAEILGFDSGDQMVREIVNAQPRAIEIEGRTDQRMLERYGDIATPEAQKRAANEAIHNEARARFIATELKAMQDALNPREEVGTTAGPTPRKITVNSLVEAAKQFAERMISARKIRDVKPAQHEAAERRAGKRVEKAMATGDTTAAITAKRDQLLNNFATKQAYAALREVESKVKYLNRVADSDTLPADYKDQIDKLLDRYDIRRSVTLTEIDRRASLLDWVESQREMGIEPNIPQELLNEAQRISYKELTVEEFRGLVDSIKQIEHLGRLKSKLLTAQDKREFEAVRDEIVTSIVDNGKGRVADTRTPNTILGEKLLGLKKFWASHIKAATWARIMDGGKDGGPMWEFIIRAANVAGDKEISMVEKSTKDLAALVAPVIAQGKLGGKGTYYPTIGRSVNREGALAMALNTGNESNLQRLLGGEGWTVDQIRPVLDSLSATDWRFVQGVWDYFESFRPEIAAKERRVNGVEPKWLEATPRVEQGVALRGGYYPVKYDTRASERAEAHADAEIARQQMKGAYTSATTRRSFTKERVDAVIGRPLLYSFDGLYSGVQEVIHDLSWHEFLIDANRLLKDKGISATMRGTYGAEAHQQFKTWLQDSAQGYVQANSNVEAAASWVRQGVSVAGLGFNLMSAFIQPLGITQTVTRIGARYTGKGVMEYLAGPGKLKDAVDEKSTFMRTRSMTRLREIAEVRSQVRGKSKTRQAIDSSAYFLMMQAQQTVDLPTWWGAYEKAIGEGRNEERAVALADQAVIDSQGSGSLKDQSAIERGGPAMKLFTVFYSFFNTTLNNAAAKTMTSTSKAQLAADYALLFVIPVILGELLKAAITPGDSGEWDDPKKVAKRLIGAELSFMFGMMVGVRELAGAIQVATGTNPYGTDYSGPAGLRPITDAYKLGKQANQGEMDDGLRKAIINTAGQLLRLPSAQINRSINGAKALAEGKTKNPAALLLGYEEPRD